MSVVVAVETPMVLPKIRHEVDRIAPIEQARMLQAVLRDERRQPLNRIANLGRMLSRKIVPMMRDQRHLRVGPDLRPDSERNGVGIDWLGFLAPMGVTWAVVGPTPRLWVPAIWTVGNLRVRIRLSGQAEGRGRILAMAADGIHESLELHRFEWADRFDCDITIPLPMTAQAIALEPVDSPGTFRIEQFSLSLRG